MGTTPDNSHRESIDDLKNLHISLLMDFSGGTSGKESACKCRRHKRHRFSSLDWDNPLEEGMATNSSTLA